MTEGARNTLAVDDKEASPTRRELSLNFAVQRSFKLPPPSSLPAALLSLLSQLSGRRPLSGDFSVPFFLPPSFVMRLFLCRGFLPVFPLLLSISLSFPYVNSYRSHHRIVAVRYSACLWMLVVTKRILPSG